MMSSSLTCVQGPRGPRSLLTRPAPALFVIISCTDLATAVVPATSKPPVFAASPTFDTQAQKCADWQNQYLPAADSTSAEKIKAAWQSQDVGSGGRG